jgi:hypothetical protein
MPHSRPRRLDAEERERRGDRRLGGRPQDAGQHVAQAAGFKVVEDGERVARGRRIQPFSDLALGLDENDHDVRAARVHRMRHIGTRQQGGRAPSGASGGFADLHWRIERNDQVPAVVRMQLAFSARSPGDQHRRPGAESAAGLVGPRRRARQQHTAMMPEPVGSVILVTP